ncbi:hypothetical protein BWD42_07075 [Sphingobacterium sp. CZ-UAM]|uniref:substrate import-associated zinc metallohydrolase lipoprotein n=1 Tax=Sphingobacterium sp. CZ-UAM TaxID=1933868 RepID=UPI000984FCC6|nr:substrate import-associated zinc metallohydrolase lipoprotein [Sphingobacterium sp. CZ-UAM]OOG19667.1 hypothetical protein BWD42_07075 [Sphingobacterium sp. CZ-UAM]
MKTLYYLLILLGISVFHSCKTEENNPTIDQKIDYFDITDKPKEKWNELDSLCDSIYNAFGVKVIYEYTPRLIRTGYAYYYPPSYEKALAYTRLMLAKFWLPTVKKAFPDYFAREIPREFILMGGYYHSTQSDLNAASGAGFNGQFYRLGMGGINMFDKSDKDELYDHLVTLWHEHAHNQDVKYGRSKYFDNISVGTYYKEAWSTKSNSTANKDGFFSAYGGFAPEEDFATGVEYITRKSKQEVLSLIETNEKLKTKYAFIYRFYNDKGMDLHRLHELCDSVVFKTTY